MKIWAHTLVKNEGRWLWFSVNSVINHVDKILLWDAGSTDDSLEIEHELKKLYPDKIILAQKEQKNISDFTLLRQEMLDATDADWFLMLDGDEIWYDRSVLKVLNAIETNDKIESIVVPTINVVGDIFHFQDKSAGRYKFGDKIGHFNLRAIKRRIPGLHSQGIHGVWGWADSDNVMIQERGVRNTFYVDAPYLHTTFLQRSSNPRGDADVVKRTKKLKYEFGNDFSKSFYYPESFFGDRPSFILSPWSTMDSRFKFRAFFETPLRKINRAMFKNQVGY